VTPLATARSDGETKHATTETAMATWRAMMALAFSGGIPRCAFIVALVIGSLLNLINQGDALIAGGPLNWWKLALTFLVPYCVSTHGAVAARLSGPRRG
jgi:hypothetical protein